VALLALVAVPGITNLRAVNRLNSSTPAASTNDLWHSLFTPLGNYDLTLAVKSGIPKHRAFPLFINSADS
jgi:hypothetical protein